MKKSKIALFLLFSIAALLLFDSCIYTPPEGYSRNHHKYDEIVEFARSIDPEAVVAGEYSDTYDDESNSDYREWDAVINGIECHVSSVSRHVFNSGIMAGEFAKKFYAVDTDYDYFLLEKIVSEKQPDWRMSRSDKAARYNLNDVITVETSYTEERELSREELEKLWAEASEIYSEYNSYPVRKTAYFSVAAPAEFVSGDYSEHFVKMGTVSLHDFSEEGKTLFFNSYAEHWKLLDSDIPFLFSPPSCRIIIEAKMLLPRRIFCNLFLRPIVL